VIEKRWQQVKHWLGYFGHIQERPAEAPKKHPKPWLMWEEEMVGQTWHLTWEEAVERLEERLEVGIYRKSEQWVGVQRLEVGIYQKSEQWVGMHGKQQSTCPTYHLDCQSPFTITISLLLLLIPLFSFFLPLLKFFLLFLVAHVGLFFLFIPANLFVFPFCTFQVSSLSYHQIWK